MSSFKPPTRCVASHFRDWVDNRFTSTATVIRSRWSLSLQGASEASVYAEVDMKHPDHHHRRSIRLPEYDYATVGAYYVTLCACGRECLFGEIVRGQMRLNDAGRIIQEEWQRTPQLRPNVELDAFITMPNHLHGIIVITESRRGVLQYAPTIGQNPGFRSPSQTLGAIVRGFKSAVTRRVNTRHNTQGNKLWQRNYYEHVIRDEKDLKEIRRYIAVNPRLWKYDEENPDGHHLMR